MVRGWGWRLGVVLWGCGGLAGAQAHGRPAAPKSGATSSNAISPATAAALLGLAGRAGAIFVGRVAAIERNDGNGYVDVVFAVETAVRGCASGSRYVLREWAGLWIGQPPRYEVGQRRLMLLAGRGASGMSAPVGGLAGVIPLLGMHEPPLLHGGSGPADVVAAARGDEGVDLRWVQALLVSDGGTQAARESRAPPIGVRPGRPVAPRPPVTGMPPAGPSLSAVLALLEGAAGGANAR